MKRKTLLALLILTISATLFSGCKSADSVENSETIETTTIESEATEETEIVEEIETETASEDDLGLGETPPYEVVDQGDYPDTRSDHQAAWDDFCENWNESDYGTTTKGKIANDFPYYGDTGYDPYGTILQERTTDKGYTVFYDTNTGRVYYSGMMLPTGSFWQDAESGGVLSTYAYNKGYNSLFDITYAEMQELLGVYNGD
ncbi:hypothetical protein MR818_10650 [bacterium]|nr:hypothetical protein [bacterium]